MQAIQNKGREASDFSTFFYLLEEQCHLVAIYPDSREIVGSFFDNPLTAHTWASAGNEKGFNIYFTVNVVRSDFTGNKPGERDIERARFAHVDVDPPKGGGPFDKQAALDRLRELLPSIIIDSGNGLQALWKLADQPPALMSEVKEHNRALALYLNGDNCHNVDRLLRVPGFTNYPGKKKREAGRVPCPARLVGVYDA